MANTRTFNPAPALTDNLRVDLMHVATAFQNKPEMLTEAMQDPATRKEITGLVNDLFSMIEVIEEERKTKAVK